MTKATSSKKQLAMSSPKKHDLRMGKKVMHSEVLNSRSLLKKKKQLCIPLTVTIVEGDGADFEGEVPK